MPNIEWLLREATDERPLMMSKRTIVDDSSWRAAIERVEIGPGLRVVLTDAEAHRDIAIEPLNDRADPWVASQVTLAGRADIDFFNGQRTYAAADHAVMFRPTPRGAAYSLKAGTRFHSAGFGLNVDHILRMFDSDVPDMLRPLLECEVSATRFAAMRSTKLMRNTAANLFARGLNGPLRMLMMEGVVVQLLAVLAASAAERELPRSRRAFSARERDAVERAYGLLLADMRQPPTLGALAAKVGLTEKRLNTGFRTVFGVTVFEALRNERLEHARIVFESGGAPLKEVAFRVGYNHVTNFINAFTARYGAPPRRYLARTSARTPSAT
jgi:AraC-like DNA-binding protein